VAEDLREHVGRGWRQRRAGYGSGCGELLSEAAHGGLFDSWRRYAPYLAAANLERHAYLVASIASPPPDEIARRTAA